MSQSAHIPQAQKLISGPRQIGEDTAHYTQPMIFSADETADVGINLTTPVVESIGSERVSKFTGHIGLEITPSPPNFRRSFQLDCTLNNMTALSISCPKMTIFYGFLKL